MTGGGSVACPMTFVFFILMDSPMRSTPSMTGVPPDLRHNCCALSANSREVKIATCTATCTCDVIVRVGGIPSCRCERVNLTFSTSSSPSTRSTGTAGENL